MRKLFLRAGREPHYSLRKFYTYVKEPVPSASIGLFRIAAGILVLSDVWSFVHSGWIKSLFIDPSFHFKYFGFSWVVPLPGRGMYLVFVVMALSAVAVTAGYAYRVAAVAMWLSFTYTFLLERALYLNHFYAFSLFIFLLCITPADAAYSVRAFQRGARMPIPRFYLLLLRFQVAVIYLGGAVAKMNSDWISGKSVLLWTAARGDMWLIRMISDMHLIVPFFSWGGLAFDSLVVPGIMWKKTRPVALAACLFFHLTNARFFNIGIFPWMMLAATTLLLPPEWPEVLQSKLGFEGHGKYVQARSRVRPVILGLASVYVVWQVLMPFRHFIYPGNVDWVQQGYLFSWRMMLREKHGSVTFHIRKRSGDILAIDPIDRLPTWQGRNVAINPDMILQYAHHLSALYDGSSVTARAIVSLNGRAPTDLVDTLIDLNRVTPSTPYQAWVTPYPGAR